MLYKLRSVNWYNKRIQHNVIQYRNIIQYSDTDDDDKQAAIIGLFHNSEGRECGTKASCM